MAAVVSVTGGVAKKIALFEFVPPDMTSSSVTRLRRKDAIKRKKIKNSHSSPPSSISSATTTTSDLENCNMNVNTSKISDRFKTTKTLWLSSSAESSSASDSYGSSSGRDGSETGNDKPIKIAPINANYAPSSSTTTTSSSDDYEVNDFTTISRKMEANIALMDALVQSHRNRRNSENYFEKQLRNRNARSLTNMRNFYQSLTLPIVRPGNLKLNLVEFTADNQLNSHSEGDLTEDEPFYEELDLYSKEEEVLKSNERQTSQGFTDKLLCPSAAKKVQLSMSGISKNDEEMTISRLDPPTPPPYESLYSELIYGQTNIIKESLSGTTLSSSQYRTPSSSLYNPSIASASTSTYTTTTTTPSGSTQENIYLNYTTNNNGHLIKHRNNFSKNHSGLDVQIQATNSQGSSLPGYYNVSKSQLPPLPLVNANVHGNTNSNIYNNVNANITGMAKLAGNKLSKKFKFLRKLSKSSSDSLEITQSCGNCSVSSGSNDTMTESRKNSNTNISTTCLSNENLNVKKLLISRPIMPPPEPPRNPPSTLALTSLQPIILSITNQHQNMPKNVTVSLAALNSNSNEDDSNNDDSDFYDSDSELIRNFVAAVQPIYSMEEEPLYQYYTYGISLQPEDNYQPVIPKNLGLTLDMLIPRTGQRTLWCEIPEVVTSGILGILSDQQKKLQEAIFEVLTSEVSYLKSLDILISLFFDNHILDQVLTSEDRKILFGNISDVRNCSQSFLKELLNKWEESWYIQDVGQIINNNAKNKFHVYKEYCRNKPYQDKVVQKLRNTNDEFVNIIKSLEDDPKCQMLRMDSFLMLPMQRITRLPLLVNAIIQRTLHLKDKSICEDALRSLTTLVFECNESARESQDQEETAAIFDQIEFPKNISSISYPGQFLLKGDFFKNSIEQQGIKSPKMNWSFQKKKRTLYWLILFTNQLFITRKKSSGKFEVIDMVAASESSIKPLPNFEGQTKDFQHYFILQFNKNESIYFLAARSQSEVERWKQKLDQLKAHKNLKVEAIFLYDAKREDELSFSVGDIIQVSQIQPDGWYFGKKPNTDESGWFPGNYCAEI